MKRKIKILNWPRKLIQWGVLFFILFLIFRLFINKSFVADFEAYCPFGGLQAFGSFLLNQSLSCTMTTAQIVMGFLLILAVLVFSKLFCSFICPLGTLTEWFSQIGKKLKIRITLTGWTDLVLRSLKYILLFITFYFTLQSNELFCKKYDPYYAAVTGFSTDVVVWYAIAALVLLVAGSIVIRMFWCKYICPLGALSNIFKFALFFVAVIAVWLAALKLGATISYVWPLAVVCLGGFLIEVFRMKSSLFPVIKVTRNETTCTNCNLCTRVCHQNIDVANLKVVKHVDCNLCSDCVVACPVNNTLQVNRRNSLKWISPVAVIILVISGLILGSVWELPTIDVKWAEPEVMAKAQIYEQSGLKNVKCFGSSTAFANQIQRIDGVLGVATYVKHHRVKIYYDPAKLSPEKLQKAIFTPSKTAIASLRNDVTSVTEITLKLENFFDPLDFIYLARLLGQKTNAVGLISEFDCPIVVKIFFPGDSIPDEQKMKEILETRTLVYETNGIKSKVNLKYKVTGKPAYLKITRTEYISLLFKPYEVQFNNYSKYDSTVVKVFKIPLGSNKPFRTKLNYLVSHLSNDDGIIELKTTLNENYEEIIAISYVDSITNEAAILRRMNSDSLLITFSSGEKNKVPNMFRFEQEDTQSGNK
jgi:polyferredoxin